MSLSTPFVRVLSAVHHHLGIFAIALRHSTPRCPILFTNLSFSKCNFVSVLSRLACSVKSNPPIANAPPTIPFLSKRLASPNPFNILTVYQICPIT
ncbi:hypothetical protein M413DRAFT_167233 [Hebeloma cylindrosporum]|uniref:Uncharacterized protein n=1 Tax=Hebeloma cylindrosporum TaxID=76867 RepID=A0A0C3C953_HEBCY|nr:hypothetical protein M413DRAFT_167233 [Hebeloma cylindrosporum h7]